MTEKKSKNIKLYNVYRRYKKVREVSVLSDFIRRNGLSEVKWPKGLSDELADLLDAAYPWSGEKRIAIDDSWIFYIYWSETEYNTGKLGKNLKKKGIREVEKWLARWEIRKGMSLFNQGFVNTMLPGVKVLPKQN